MRICHSCGICEDCGVRFNANSVCSPEMQQNPGCHLAPCYKQEYSTSQINTLVEKAKSKDKWWLPFMFIAIGTIVYVIAMIVICVQVGTIFLGEGL